MQIAAARVCRALPLFSPARQARAQLRLFEPVEREQGALDPAELGKSKIEPVLPLVGCELAHDDGRRDGAVLDRGDMRRP